MGNSYNYFDSNGQSRYLGDKPITTIRNGDDSMSKNLFSILFFILFVTVQTSHAGIQSLSNENKVREAISPQVNAAWGNAGALIGWLAQSKYGQWQYLQNKPREGYSLPVFLWREFKPGLIAKLPAPSVPFAIGIGGTKFDNAGLKELSKFQNLQALDISHTRVTDSGLKQLSKISGLQSIDLGASLVTDVGLQELAKIKQLRKLHFGSTAVTDAGVEELLLLENLKTLYLYNTKVSDSGILKLIKLKHLNTLILGKTQVTDSAVKKLIDANPKMEILR